MFINEIGYIIEKLKIITSVISVILKNRNRFKFVSLNLKKVNIIYSKEKLWINYIGITMYTNLIFFFLKKTVIFIRTHKYESNI